jgi:hypothetical protein
MFIVFLVTATTWAANPCPWEPSEKLDVVADMASVSVNGTDYVVRGRDQRLEFEALLAACDMPQARQHFRAWRAHRRGLNWTVGLTPLWLSTVVGVGLGTGLAIYHPLGAQNQKTWMIEAIAERR